MNLRIVYPNPETGGVNVVIPAPSARLKGETDAVFASRILNKDVPAGLRAAARIVDVNSLPADRAWRNAWELDVTSVKVSMPKARAIHLQNLRHLRNEKLAATDSEKLKLEEQRRLEELDALLVKRQALRDMPVQATADMQAIADPVALKAYVPDALK